MSCSEPSLPLIAFAHLWSRKFEGSTRTDGSGKWMLGVERLRLSRRFLDRFPERVCCDEEAVLDVFVFVFVFVFAVVAVVFVFVVRVRAVCP